MVWVLVALPHKKKPCQRYHTSATIENRHGAPTEFAQSSEGRPRWRLPASTHRCFHACHPPITMQLPRSKGKKQKCWSGISEGSRSTPQLVLLHTRKRKSDFSDQNSQWMLFQRSKLRADCKLRSTKDNHLQHYPRGMITPTWGKSNKAGTG